MDIAPDGVAHARKNAPVGIRVHACATPVKRDPEALLLERIRELEATLRGRDEFLAVLGHELRNPLQPIRNVAEVVRALGHSDGRLMKACDVLERQVAHMSRLVDDLLDTSRMTWGRLTLETEIVNIVAVLAGAVETMQPRLTSRGHVLTMKSTHEEMLVHADPTRLAQVFCNLLDNAIKYTPEGGGIEVEVLRDGSDAVIRFVDKGVGIPAPMLTAIFELFTQVKPTSDRTGGGLGLGLPLVRKLVEMHEGSVEARSDGPGKGSEFVVRLPLRIVGTSSASTTAISA